MHLPSREQLGSVRWHQQRLHGSGISPPPAASNSPPATPKKVPPTPNNTPATTRITPSTKSLAVSVNKTKKKTKMVKQKSTRGRDRDRSRSGSDSRSHSKEKRHLCRWTPELDQKLTLSIQYVCNGAGLAIPWDEIGRVMGPGITGSAVVQHLAKTRARMVARGLDVPPPLKRGGSSRIAPSGIGSATVTKATTNSKAKANSSNLAAKPTPKTGSGKVKKANKKASAYSDDSDSDGGDWKDDDSDAEYGEPVTKRAKNSKPSMKRKFKEGDSDEEDVPQFKMPKRKAKESKPPAELSAYGDTDINGVPINYDSDTEDETNDGVVGAGQPWLNMDDDDYASHPKTGMKTPFKKSLVVALSTPVKVEAGGNEGNMVDVVQPSFGDYHVKDHQHSANTYMPDFTAGVVFDNNAVFQSQPFDQSAGFQGAYNGEGDIRSQMATQGGGYGSPFGFDDDNDINMPNAFGNNVGSGVNSDAYNTGSGNIVPYPIQTSWPHNHGFMGPSSDYTSVDQTPAATSAGPDYNGGYFGNSQFNNGHVNNSHVDNSQFNNNQFGNSQFDLPQFDNADFDFLADTDDFLNTDEIDGNSVGGFFGSDAYGN